MGNEKSKFDRDNTLIWVTCVLLGMVMVQMYFTLQFKETIREQEVVITKLKSVKPNTAKIDSLKTQIKDLEEWIADEDERCAIQIDQFYTQMIQQQYDKNNSK